MDSDHPDNDPRQDPERTRRIVTGDVSAESARGSSQPRDQPIGEETTPLWTAKPDSSALDRIVAERYRLKEVLGRGGFATVYIAEDTLLERPVALKLLEQRSGNEEDAARFLREARTVARLRHPNVVLLYDAGQDPLGLYLVLELITGKSLEERVGEPLPIAEAVKIIRQAASGLAAAHDLDIVHRDIKPGNVLMTDDGVAKLTDFGLAQRQGESRLTAEGHVVGTPSYMAPEQIEGGEIGPPVDLFALGCLFQELLAGRSPFRAPTLSETFARILRGRPESLPGEILLEESGLCHLIGRMLDKKAAKRPKAAEVAEALQVWESNRELGYGTNSLSGTLFKPQRNLPLAGIAVAALLAIGAGGAWFFIDHGEAPVETVEKVQVEQVDRPEKALDIPDELPEELEESGENAELGVLDLAEKESEALDLTEEEDPESPQVVANTAALKAIQEVLIEHNFRAEEHRFLSANPSSRRISFAVEDMATPKFLREVARAANWSVVLHTSVSRAPRLTLSLEDVPWDVAVESVLERQGLRATRYGEVWLISSAQRSTEMAQRIAPSVVIRRPEKESASKMADALQAAKSEQGVVLYSRRLKAVLIVDRVDAFPGYGKIWSALDQGAKLEVPTREYSGDPISLNLERAEVSEVIRTMAQLGGLNAVLHDEVEGRISIDVSSVPWDNAFEPLLLSLDLTFRINDNVVEVRRLDEEAELHVETVTVRRDPEFFEPLARSLTEQGSLNVTDDTIILRDRKDRATWLRGLIQRIDDMSRSDVPE